MIPEKDILQFIPQRAPFVMIDELTACDDESAKTALNILEKNLFVEKGLLTEPALVENIAQTAAARIGYICKQANKPVPIGYIAAVQNLVIKELPKTGSRLETEVIIKNEVLNVTIVAGHVRMNDRVIASCEMKIFVTK